jgi:hypothetical protein
LFLIYYFVFGWAGDYRYILFMDYYFVFGWVGDYQPAAGRQILEEPPADVITNVFIYLSIINPRVPSVITSLSAAKKNL